MFLLIQKSIAELCVFVMLCFGVLTGSNNFDTMTKYRRNVALVKQYQNTIETAVPQTEIRNIITDHFNSELPDGKTEKKAIVIGYDGCRADALCLANEDGAVLPLSKDGSLLLSYCGGVNYPALNTQATSTAPGWCSMLTGEWANVHHVLNNNMPKSNDYLTILTTLVQDNVIDDSAFYVSWTGHFENKLSTYKHEKEYIKEKGLDVNFLCAGNDDGTLENILTDVTGADCTDFIFSILEYCDHVGHDSGFNLGNGEYTKAFSDSEAAAVRIINAIQARDTYDTEDWLIIITSDHGGYNTIHGAMSIQERITFISCNKVLEYN